VLPTPPPLARDAVDLVEEDGGRGVVPRHVEEDAHLQQAKTRRKKDGHTRGDQVEDRIWIRRFGLTISTTTPSGTQTGTGREKGENRPHARTIFSDSPRYLLPSVEAETLKKVVAHSVATALASMVFPVPGGPKSNIPWEQ